jgi:hypothetical protein
MQHDIQIIRSPGAIETSVKLCARDLIQAVGLGG